MPVVQFRTKSSVHSIALNSQGDTLAVGTSEQTEIYRVFPPPACSCEPLFVLHCPALQGGVAFSDQNELAVGGNQLVSVFDLDSGGMLLKMEREDRVRCVAISDDGECLVVGGFDKRVAMQHLERGSELYHFSYDGKSVVKAVRLLATCTLPLLGMARALPDSEPLHSSTNDASRAYR